MRNWSTIRHQKLLAVCVGIAGSAEAKTLGDEEHRRGPATAPNGRFGSQATVTDAAFSRPESAEKQTSGFRGGFGERLPLRAAVGKSAKIYTDSFTVSQIRKINSAVSIAYYYTEDTHNLLSARTCRFESDWGHHSILSDRGGIG